MASRRMRIKAVAKVPSLGKSRPSDRPTTPMCGYTEPSSPGIHSSYSPADVSVASPKASGGVMSPLMSYPPSPTQKILNTSDDRIFPLNSPGIMSPSSPHSHRSNYASAPSSPMPSSNPGGNITNPESPRRPTTPMTPSSFQGENSQDKIMSPVYSPSYSAFSPGVGPGISMSISRAPTPKSPALALSPAVMSEDSNSSVASSSRSISRGSSKPKAPKRPPPFSQTNNASQSNSALKEVLSPGTSLISAALNNSETLRQRLQKGTIVPSTSKYAMIRKDYLAKYQNKLPDPKDLTMLHYAFFNPPKAEQAGEGEGKGETELGGPKVGAKRRRRTESRDSVASSLSVASNPAPPPEIPSEKEAEPSPEPVGPRVKVGPDGQLIIDEKSLVIETTQAQKAKKQLAEMETVSGSSFIVGSSGLYSRKKPLKRGVDWDEKETMKFYKALITCGTDFSMMATVFKGSRTRSELKAKFKREDRRNPQQVNKALAKQCFDPTLALTDSEDEESVIADSGDSNSRSKDNDSNDIENVKAPKRRKNEFKKTLQELKKKGELVGPIVPPLRSVSFRRPAGKLDWEMYNVMKKNILESKSSSQEERDVYNEAAGPSYSREDNNLSDGLSNLSPAESSSDARKKSDPKVTKKAPKVAQKVLGFDSEDPLGFNIVSSGNAPTSSNLSVPSLEMEPNKPDASLQTLNIISSGMPAFTLVAVDSQQIESEETSAPSKSVQEQDTVEPERSMSSEVTPTVEDKKTARKQEEIDSTGSTKETSSHESSSNPNVSGSSTVGNSSENATQVSTSADQSTKRNVRSRRLRPQVRIPGPGAHKPKKCDEDPSVEEIEIEITCK